MSAGIGRSVVRELAPMVHARLPFGINRTLYAAGPGVSLERVLGQHLSGIAATDVANLARGVEVTLPGTGRTTSAALVARSGNVGLVPLAEHARPWEASALRSARVSAMNPHDGTRPGSNLTALEHDIFALIEGDTVVRPTGSLRR